MKLSLKKDIIVYEDLKAGKYTVIFFRLINGSYTVIDEQKINIRDEKFKYKEKEFMNFNRNRTLFSDKKTNYYGFDYDSCKQIQFNLLELPKTITLEELDRYLNKGLIKQLAYALEKPKSDKSQWIMFIIGAVVGGMAGFIISSALSSGAVI